MLGQIIPAYRAAAAGLVHDVECEVGDFFLAHNRLYRARGAVHAAAGTRGHHDLDRGFRLPFRRGAVRGERNYCGRRANQTPAEIRKRGHARIVYYRAPSTNRRSELMKSYWIIARDGRSVLEPRDVPVPKPQREEVLMRVHATALNRGELIVGGAVHGGPERLGGTEAAGVVEAVGEGVSGWKKGDRVMRRARGP